MFLREGLPEPEFYGDLVCKKKLIGRNDFSFQFRKNHHTLQTYIVGYNLNVMRQFACLFFNPIMVDNYAAFFNCVRSGVKLCDGPT